MKTHGYAARSADTALAPYSFERRRLRPDDVALKVLYCGICHTDLHITRNDWGGTIYPSVPGHEIVGRVTEIGTAVTRFEVGSTIAIGCMVDSSQHCDQCRKGQEQYCRLGFTPTYNGNDRVTNEVTYGGYLKLIVVREEFVLRMPEGMDASRTAPLLCAGITTYSPLRHWNVGPGSRVAVIGLGGLGHMAVKLAVGLGSDVTVMSRTKAKETDALALGADRILISTDQTAMTEAQSRFDLIIDTIPVEHDTNPYVSLLNVDGTLVVVGQVGPLPASHTFPMIFGRRRIAGSLIGGLAETQVMLDFCSRKNIYPDCEMLRMDQINEAFERLERSDVRYRFVIDMASLQD